MATSPAMRISWVTPPGIHTARWGGTAQLPSRVAMSMAPCAAKMSWARSWLCGSDVMAGGEVLGHGGHGAGHPLVVGGVGRSGAGPGCQGHVRFSTIFGPL